MGDFYIGQYIYSTDSKGRLALPAKFRSSLKQGAVVTKGLDGSLFLYPKAAWQEIAAKISRLPLAGRDSRAFARLMLAGAMEVKPDSQGRILIPDYLRDYACLKKKVVIMGVYDRLEIWDEGCWQKYQKQVEASGDEIAERLSELGI